MKVLVTTLSFLLLLGSSAAFAQPNGLVLRHLTTGSNYFNTGNYGGAIVSFTAALELRPTLADGYFNRGYAKFKLKDYVGAIDDFDETIAWSPADAQAYYLRAEAHRELKDLPEAERDYTQALAFGFKKLEPIFYNRALIALQLKHYAEAEADLQRVLRTSPNRYGLNFKLGLLAYQTKRPREAAEYLTQFLIAQPANTSVRLLRANIYSEEELFESAIADYTYILATEPDNGGVLYQRGLAYANSGDQTQACRDLQAASFYGYTPALARLKATCK